MDIKNIIKNEMAAQSRKQEEFCSKIGYRQSSFSQFLNGKRPAPLTVLQKMMDELSLTICKK